MPVSQSLDVASDAFKLSGRHLIEASAGTGKTYSITRLYLRLLLEKGLSVQQILVMTFTRAATEELRGRIAATLREAIEQWDDLATQDPFFSTLQARGFDAERVRNILAPALLLLDEAAVFTIHGFCKRALNTQAFASGLALQLSMESDSREALLSAVQDWWRQTCQDSDKAALLDAKGWHEPEQFIKEFKRPLNGRNPLTTPSEEELQTAFFQRKQQVLHGLLAHQTLIFETLVEPHKKADERANEWRQLVAWLENSLPDNCPTAVGAFIHGRRYPKNETMTAVFADIKRLQKDSPKCLKALEDVASYTLVIDGINHIRQRFSENKQRQGMMDFDDLIVHLRESLEQQGGDVLAAALRQQYPVALVDEFQDTDEHQYAILDALYPAGHTAHALFMIGDPKQAIYAFRGGDVFTYLSARQEADYHWYMTTNWRSVKDMVTAYNRLFGGGVLSAEKAADVFDFGIPYEPVAYSPQASAAQVPLHDTCDDRAAVNYVCLSAVSQPSGQKGEALTDDWKQALATWCVAEISRLLQQAQVGKNPLQEQDIALLVRTGTEAALLQTALSAQGFPSVYLSNKDNVYHSPQAMELGRVLRGLLACEDSQLLTASLSTALMGGSAQALRTYRHSADESAWEAEREQAQEYRKMWQTQGCLPLILHLIRTRYRPPESSHARALTNTIHLAELLQQASLRYKQPQQLLRWFDAQCRQDNAQEEQQLRLDSDDQLIRIITQHSAKGLEYPVVFIPFASLYKNPTRAGNRQQAYFECHQQDEASHWHKQHWLGAQEAVIQQATREAHAESVRLLYVAITRAMHRCYVGVAPFKNSELSPLGLTLAKEESVAWEATLTALVESSAHSSTLLMPQEPFKPYPRPVKDGDKGTTQVATFTHTLIEDWRLSSFSALSRGAHVWRHDKKERSDVREGQTAEGLDQRLRFSLPKGAATGNLLHDLLEYTDFSQPQWDFETPLLRFGGLSEEKQQALQRWLEDCLQTPLPPISPAKKAFSLSRLSRGQTLREAEFYFPVEGLSVKKLATVLQQYRHSETAVRLPATVTLQGMMHGFIDLIFEQEGRFYVADYKSTHLGNRVEDYHHAALKANNQQQLYDLQYLIYSVALHRYLQTRLPDYQPQRHFGGVYYLYLRGMSTGSAESFGVFQEALSAEFLTQLDTVFGEMP